MKEFQNRGFVQQPPTSPLLLFMLQILMPGVFQICPLLSLNSNLFLSAFQSRRRFLSSTVAVASLFMSDSLQTGGRSSNPANIRWGIVGLGDVTAKKSGPPFFKCNGSSLVAVMRRSPGKAAEWAQRMVPGGQCVGYDNLDDFLRHDGLDAVYIATPPGQHADICRKVAAAGKAVYVEKPVGRCAAETREIVSCMEAAGKPLYTAYISRAYERTQTLRRLLREGYIGARVESVEYKFQGNIVPHGFDKDSPPWRLIAEQAGGGEVMDIGCHIVDRIDYLCGPLMDVDGMAENKNSPFQQVEDFVSLQAKVGPSSWAAIPSEGATVACEWDFSGTSNETVDEFVISGPNGCIKMAGMSPSLPISVYDNSNKLVKQVEFATPDHTAQPLIQAVTDDLGGVDKAPFLSFGDNAVRASEVLDKILDPYYGGREIGFWARPESWPGKH
ncbi:hypothetical protein ACA910_003325 [Epithemia clementina (nom. ined.)]